LQFDADISIRPCTPATEADDHQLSQAELRRPRCAS
jgi:hypothetical protein